MSVVKFNDVDNNRTLPERVELMDDIMPDSEIENEGWKTLRDRPSRRSPARLGDYVMLSVDDASEMNELTTYNESFQSKSKSIG